MLRILPLLCVALLAAVLGPASAAAPGKAGALQRKLAAAEAVDKLLAPGKTKAAPVPPRFTWPASHAERIASVDWTSFTLFASGIARLTGHSAYERRAAELKALAAARLAALDRLYVLPVDNERTLSDLLTAQPHLARLVDEALSKTDPTASTPVRPGLLRVSVRLDLAKLRKAAASLVFDKTLPPDATSLGKRGMRRLRRVYVFSGVVPYGPALVPSLRGFDEASTRRLHEALGAFIVSGGRILHMIRPRARRRAVTYTARSSGGIGNSTLVLSDTDAAALASLLESHKTDRDFELVLLPGKPGKSP